MSYEIEFNARSIPAADVARSFVPPEPHFIRLLNRNHTLLLGPRGSGKTTLLKMLTVKALTNWDHPSAAENAKKIAYNAAFVAADVAWGRQLDSLGGLAMSPHRKEAAFAIHSLRALVRAMREAIHLGQQDAPEHLRHLAVAITPKQESNFVKSVSSHMGLQPRLDSMLGLELDLQGRLDSINNGLHDNSFNINTFQSKLSYLITAFNGEVGDDDRRWALLFDELEIAPAAIKKFLFSSIRSMDERIIVKLAVAPYMDDSGFDFGPESAQSLHDYHTIELTYPNKEDANNFSSSLFRKTFQRSGIEYEPLRALFELPLNKASFARRTSRISAPEGIPSEFISLASKDASFKKYADDRLLFSESYTFNENNVAQDFRKIQQIVLARDYYIKSFHDGQTVAHRSRKSHDLYIGYNPLLEITEGNPRAILTLLVPMIQEYKFFIGALTKFTPIPVEMQSRAVKRVELLLTSLLQVIPLELDGFDPGKGLLDFVDTIGRAFETRLLKQAFKADYLGTFILDENLTQDVAKVVGKALNAGAIVHVPHKDSAPDIILRSVKNKRYRLSYALAARYRLLLTLGDSISLSGLLRESKGSSVSLFQPSLFEGGN